MKRSVVVRFLAVSSVYLLGGVPIAAMAQTTSTSSSGTVTASSPSVPPGSSPVSQKLVSSFTVFAGSEENAASLVGGLRSGSRITLAPVASTVPPTATGGGSFTDGSVSFIAPTHPMGWGNVRHALTLAQRELAAQGIANPTPTQLQAALMGGFVTTSSGRIVTLQGVLTLRSQGMGWGRIAHTLGVPMAHAESIHAFSHPEGHRYVPLNESRHESRAVSASGHRVGTVTTASGEIVRASSRWSGEGSSHARIVGGDAAVSARAGGAQTLPAASTKPTASGFGLRTAADRGGLGGNAGRWNGR